ncbi:DUF6924 domain-containing protein [Rhodococcoides fascians]|uniref:DUF6924 domain-containing protein n=1 Tax=Rhodococcoides fascians TaxID=1828 RepID=UPI00050BE592|nr:hypothetical protein [Rhodococcus fascians]
MPQLPEGQSLLIRTYFGDDDAWEHVARETQARHTQDNGVEAQAFLTVVDDREFADMTVSNLVELISPPPPDYLFVVDQKACDEAEHPVLVVDTRADPHEDRTTFRVVPSRLVMIENNLSIANLSFGELRDAADSDGVYREAAPSRERQVSHDDLIDAAFDAQVTPVVMQLREDLLQTSRIERPAIIDPDLASTSAEIAGRPYRLELTMGYEDTLESLGRGGTGLGVHVALLYSYWSVFLDPGDLSLRAAMKVYYPPQATPRPRTGRSRA